MNARKLEGMTYNPVWVDLKAGTTTTYTTTVTSRQVINGKFGTTLAAQTNTASPTTDINTGAAFVALADDEICAFVWGLNLAGAIKVAQGPIQSTSVGVTTTAGDVHTPPQFPALPDDFCPIGYTLIQTAPSASAWTFGSSNWDATGITDTWVNVSVLPDRPQTS